MERILLISCPSCSRDRRHSIEYFKKTGGQELRGVATENRPPGHENAEPLSKDLLL